MRLTVPPSAALRGGLLIAAIAFSLSLLTRLALLVYSRADLSWNVSLLGAFATGGGFDLLAALFVTGPWWLLCWFVRSQNSLLLVLAIYLAVLGFIAVAEAFFWDEFQTRFNFIAVDYLIWTQEVWGNIHESYPLALIFGALACFVSTLLWGLKKLRVIAWAVPKPEAWQSRFKCCFFALGLILGCGWFFKQSDMPQFTNQYAAEIAKNGIFSFGAAFWDMELDYDRFYRTLPREEAFAKMRQQLAEPAATVLGDTLQRRIIHAGPEKRWNVILVCMESMSAEFMAHFGSRKGLTPNLDRFAEEGLCFEALYATGTRTVRGMEALTLCLPPTPGQAILYRPAGVALRTAGAVFAERGYDRAFIYGGDGRFDYMNRFFGTCGYTVIDKPAWKDGDISFETSWGACDEDSFRKAISEADASHSAGKPFHQFIMTTSNHRPFQFPSGKISRASDTGRDAAVMYADYAVGELVKQAATKPWFANTVFVFVADHCASSAGKMELDCRRYHIPAIVWNPALVAPQKITGMCSQVDLMPSLFALMHWSYESRFFGRDALAAAPQRAYISNYQKIAQLTPQHLVILKPRRETSLYNVRLRSGLLTPNQNLEDLETETMAAYQTASALFHDGNLKLP
jgi:phosphoglycerol transferase MdoB-like AlkP superfamily enzyme